MFTCNNTLFITFCTQLFDKFFYTVDFQNVLYNTYSPVKPGYFFFLKKRN